MLQHPTETLIQNLAHAEFDLRQLEVSVLRTDRIHPVISGNKWMKLQPWLQKAKSIGVHAIISKGGPWSNHLHAAAYACHLEKLEFTAIVKAKPGYTTATLEDIEGWGGKIIYADHERYVDEVYWENLAFVNDALYIPMGGEGREAIVGVEDFFDDLSLDDCDYILCPVGTGTTLSGIAGSTVDYKCLLGFDPGINDKGYDELISDLEEQFPSKKFGMQGDPALKKFGQFPDFLPGKMNQWYQQWQLPTDIIYTAKMFCHFENLVADGFFETGSSILLIHTGGLQGNRSLLPGLLTF